jgi:hypothetical protein
MLCILDLGIIWNSLDVYSTLMFYFAIDKLNREEDGAGSWAKTLIL